MRAVNLLPDQGRGGGPPVLTTTSVGVGGGAIFLVVAIFFCVLFLHEHGRVSSRHHQLATIQSQITTLQAQTAQRAAAASASSSANESRVAAFDQASSARVNWDNLLDDVSRVLPAGTWLSTMNMQAGSPASTTTTTPTTPGTTPTPTAFVVSGVAFSQDLVAKLMQRLALIPAISDVTLQSTSRADIGTTKAYQFSVSANINPPTTVAN